MITQEDAIKSFHYNPMTGSLTWRQSPNKRIVVGEEAGYVSRDGRGGPDGVRYIRFNGKIYSRVNMIFLYMTGKIPRPRTIEYIDQNRSNTEWNNLRIRPILNRLTQDHIKEYLRYSPETGIFIWIKKSGNNTVLYGQAGSMDAKGYLKIMLLGSRYSCHRLAFLYMTGNFPESYIDHINHDRSDNRWENLRQVSNGENSKNQSLYKNNKSGIAGVRQAGSVWTSKIGNMHLGTFDSLEAAIAAREKAERELDYHPNHGKIQ